MDTSLLGLEEHFSTYYVYDGSDPCNSDDNNKGYFNEWEDERELNGDIGLIPESSSFSESLKDMTDLTDSPPSLLFQKMIDWSAFIYVDGVDTLPDTFHEMTNFDLAKFIDEPAPKVRSAGKKIDKVAQKYVVDRDEDVDVETVFEGASLPVLEANDAFSLLEQFEASEKPNLANKSDFSNSLVNLEQIPTSPIEIFEKVPQAPIDIFEESTEKPKKPQGNKQIIEALPQELIARINESGKRKPITVIPPIPAKKRAATRSVDSASQHRNKVVKLSEQIQSDHNYCSTTVQTKESEKDSGFQSEEDDRLSIRNQPMVKTADGKLMVSLLKVNTIKSNPKKKLNLEEYKKRRFISSNATSQSNSPASSTCSSPLPEDEHMKRLKHQEKLSRMAAAVLTAQAKSGSKPVKEPEVAQKPPPVVEKICPPPDLEVRTYISTATNTDISSIKVRKSIAELEEIKPLLKKVSNKINSNSFITSLIENIPKSRATLEYVTPESNEVVREDKVIHYLKKDRVPVHTETVAVQTDFEDEEPRYRRRIGRRSSTSSSSSSCSRRSRSSNSSSSLSSSSSRSRSSRSRSSSPKRSRQYSAERLREVEERRVIYVGRITSGTSKEDLRRRFGCFGLITNVSLHFRNHGDNYGFVTFANKEDAYEAVEHGNDRGYPKYDLSFGGRRIFCKTSYSDLDNMREDDYNGYHYVRAPETSFDALLRAAQEKLRKRKS